MSEGNPSIAGMYRHSMVIASDFRIPSPEKVRPLLERNRSGLAEMGAHHVLIYRSIAEPGRVLVMIGVGGREPVVDLLRSGAFHSWFDTVGVQDLPAVFAGEIIERFDFTEHGGGGDEPGHAVIAAIVAAQDTALLAVNLGASRERFRAAGIRKTWVFGAFDDPGEVLILQEVADEAAAKAWVRRHDAAADWMAETGIGVYPPLFLGEFVALVEVDPPA
ncbi:MAG TPA: fatty-acid--CoA ligase [Mycobacterium sp.]|nr:fatty-acid--CoA ligase [Mycobacterium sp.]